MILYLQKIGNMQKSLDQIQTDYETMTKKNTALQEDKKKVPPNSIWFSAPEPEKRF